MPPPLQLTIYPAIWTSSTQAIVKSALGCIGEASKLRLAIDNVCQEVVLQERSVSPRIPAYLCLQCHQAHHSPAVDEQVDTPWC